jgi:hypothetical protein
MRQQPVVESVDTTGFPRVIGWRCLGAWLIRRPCGRGWRSVDSAPLVAFVGSALGEVRLGPKTALRSYLLSLQAIAFHPPRQTLGVCGLGRFDAAPPSLLVSGEFLLLNLFYWGFGGRIA